MPNLPLNIDAKENYSTVEMLLSPFFEEFDDNLFHDDPSLLEKICKKLHMLLSEVKERNDSFKIQKEALEDLFLPEVHIAATVQLFNETISTFYGMLELDEKATDKKIINILLSPFRIKFNNPYLLEEVSKNLINLLSKVKKGEIAKIEEKDLTSLLLSEAQMRETLQLFNAAIIALPEMLGLNEKTTDKKIVIYPYMEGAESYIEKKKEYYEAKAKEIQSIAELKGEEERKSKIEEISKASLKQSIEEDAFFVKSFEKDFPRTEGERLDTYALRVKDTIDKKEKAELPSSIQDALDKIIESYNDAVSIVENNEKKEELSTKRQADSKTAQQETAQALTATIGKQKAEGAVEKHPLVVEQYLEPEEFARMSYKVTNTLEHYLLGNRVSKESFRTLMNIAKKESQDAFVNFFEKHYNDGLITLFTNRQYINAFTKRLQSGFVTFAECDLLSEKQFKECIEKDISPYYFVSHIEPDEKLQSKIRELYEERYEKLTQRHLKDIILKDAKIQNPSLYEKLQKKEEEDLNQRYQRLYDAIIHNDKKTLLECIEEGANINSKNDANQSLSQAIYTTLVKKNFDMAELLFLKGANINIKNEKGETFLHSALIENRSDIFEFLIKKNADVTIRDANGETPLHLTASRGDIKAARLLMQRGADINTMNHIKTTKDSIHLAAANGHLDFVKLLVRRAANIDQRAQSGTTPLHEASKNGHFDTAEFLLNNGADTKIRNNEGKTPLDLARDTKNQELIDLLQKRSPVSHVDQQTARRDTNTTQTTPRSER